MISRRKLKGFCREDDGAVTVDWVVLTASVVAIGVFALSAIDSGTRTATASIAVAITTHTDDMFSN